MDDETHPDRAAVLAAIRGETAAWLQRDFDAWAAHWVQAPETRRMEAWTALGVRVDDGWDAIAARIRAVMARFPGKQPFEARVRWERLNVVVVGNAAWVTFDQIGSDTGEDRKRQLRILHRIDGSWKIACLVMMECSVEEARCPLIEIDAEGRILWMNHLARERLPDHPGLANAAGRLRARRRACDPALRAAVAHAHRELASQRPLNVMPRQAWAVPLGEDDAAVPLFGWVLLEDGRALVSFDDAETLAHRMASAGEVYRLSPAQLRLARALVEGHDLAAAARLLGVSVNTLRTQLQRIFDKTGVRSQAAVVRVLLSAEPPVR